MSLADVGVGPASGPLPWGHGRGAAQITVSVSCSLFAGHSTAAAGCAPPLFNVSSFLRQTSAFASWPDPG